MANTLKKLFFLATTATLIQFPNLYAFEGFDDSDPSQTLAPIIEEDEPMKKSFLDKSMTTINPSAKILGPIYRHDDESKLKYGTEVTRLLLKNADRIARVYRDKYDDRQAYFAFLVMAMTVPLQESLYMHFREVENYSGLCNQHAANGNILFAPNPEILAENYSDEELAEAKANSTNFKHFNLYFRELTNPYFPNCELVDGDYYLTQMMRGYDGSDVGIMQLSIRWHDKDYLKNKKYLSVEESIQYGLNLLNQGFRSAYHNFEKYHCLRTEVTTKENDNFNDYGDFFWWEQKKNYVINYKNLVRGVWAGWYNSGQLDKTCRFDDIFSPHAPKDEHFTKNINKVLDYPNSSFGNSLAEMNIDEDAQLALDDVMKNFKGESDETSNFDSFIGR